MATLMMTHNSRGSLQGRCDARCYDAEGPNCDCICGGKNHGVGLEQAQQNVEETFRAIAEEAGIEITPAWRVQLQLEKEGA